ncbi:hypothetical protein BJY52DRAFT_1186740 [Lactarius psammicola]|nr:hypothetical protein BJY52DRAFT_1186740 [Lactarius psammicola]
MPTPRHGQESQFVTEACIVEPGVSDQLNSWLTIICNAIAEKHVHLPETSHLFLEVHQDLGTCNYYFVDHVLRTVFWLHTLDMVSIRPPRSLLKRPPPKITGFMSNCSPRPASEYSAAALNETLDVLMCACAGETKSLVADTPGSDVQPLDALTIIPLRAFPYTDEECERLIEILERSKGPLTDPLIPASHRSFIHFDSKRSLILTIISKMLLFSLPEDHRARFESLRVDQLIYTSRWRKHVSETVDDLKQEMSWILALLSANILMMRISPFPTLTKLALILCVLGLTLTLILLRGQRRLVGTKATTSLDDLITSYSFQPIAIVRSLPQALFVWSLLLFAVQHFWMAFAGILLTSLLSMSLLVAVVLLVAFVVILTALHPCPKFSKMPRYRYLRPRNKGRKGIRQSMLN